SATGRSSSSPTCSTSSGPAAPGKSPTPSWSAPRSASTSRSAFPGNKERSRITMSRYLAGLAGVLLPLAGPRGPGGVVPCPQQTPPATPVAAPPPPASIKLGLRHGPAVPARCGHAHTGAGNVDVAQPSPDTVVVTMTGVAAAGANPCKESLAAVSFGLCQDFEVRFDSPKLKKAKLVIEARVIGLLRSACKGGGTAQEGPGGAT